MTDPNAAILSFDKSKERINRQFSVVYPLRTVYPETQKSKISDEIRERKRKVFIDQGTMGLVETQEEIDSLARTLARLKYGVDNILFHDLGACIHSALTKPHSEVSFHHVKKLRDDDTGRIAKTVVTVSLEGILKLTLGPLVNDHGRAITGAGKVVKEQKKRLLEVLLGKRGEPFAIASVNAKTGKAAVYAKPIIIEKYGTQDNVFNIMIDNSFFPVAEVEERMKSKEIYLHQVAGLSSVLAFGRHLMKEDGFKGLLPNTPEAHKAILFMQAACEAYTFAPDIITARGNGRFDFTFRRLQAVKDLRPQAVRSSDDYIRYKEFSEFIAGTGKMYLTALRELDIAKHLHKETIVPATDKGAEFPKGEELKEIVYIKADNIQRGLDNI